MANVLEIDNDDKFGDQRINSPLIKLTAAQKSQKQSCLIYALVQSGSVKLDDLKSAKSLARD